MIKVNHLGRSQQLSLLLFILTFAIAVAVAGIIPPSVLCADDSNAVDVAQPSGDFPPHSNIQAETAVPIVPGLTYDSVNYSHFNPYSSSSTKVVNPGFGAYSTGGSLTAPIDLPHGSSIYDITVWGGAGGHVNIRRANHGIYTWDTIADVILPAGTGLVSATVTLPTPVLVDTGQASYHLQSFSGSAETAILSVRIGYQKVEEKPKVAVIPMP